MLFSSTNTLAPPSSIVYSPYHIVSVLHLPHLILDSISHHWNHSCIYTFNSLPSLASLYFSCKTQLWLNLTACSVCPVQLKVGGKKTSMQIGSTWKIILKLSWVLQDHCVSMSFFIRHMFHTFSCFKPPVSPLSSSSLADVALCFPEKIEASKRKCP